MFSDDSKDDVMMTRESAQTRHMLMLQSRMRDVTEGWRMQGGTVIERGNGKTLVARGKSARKKR